MDDHQVIAAIDRAVDSILRDKRLTRAKQDAAISRAVRSIAADA